MSENNYLLDSSDNELSYFFSYNNVDLDSDKNINEGLPWVGEDERENQNTIDVTPPSDKQEEKDKYNSVIENNKLSKKKRKRSREDPDLIRAKLLPKFNNFAVGLGNDYIKALGYRNKKLYTIDYKTELTNNADSYSLFYEKTLYDLLAQKLSTKNKNAIETNKSNGETLDKILKNINESKQAFLDILSWKNKDIYESLFLYETPSEILENLNIKMKAKKVKGKFFWEFIENCQENDSYIVKLIEVAEGLMAYYKEQKNRILTNKDNN